MIGIIDYGAGNVRSVSNALTTLGVQHFISGDVKELRRASKIIFPGVGEARSAMASLERTGVTEWIRSARVPFLGICLGMQLLFEHTSERETTCLGIMEGAVKRFPVGVRVPHMGWNTLTLVTEDPLFQGVQSGEFFYFIHSYFAPLTAKTIGTTDYSGDFSSAIRIRNFRGVQFHPEKSGEAGLRLLSNFVILC
ncbi:MAG: imidazole glycerol phosphate synthase subunit HisH [Bacteroidota bacterium]